MLKKIKEKYSSINLLLSKKLRYLYFLNFLVSISVSFFEIIGIGSIFIFIGAIIDPAEFFSNYRNFEIVDYVISLDEKSRLLFLSSALLILFLLKGMIIFISNCIQSVFSNRTIVYISSNLFKTYLQKEYSFHLRNNPSTLNQRIHNETNHAAMYLEWLLKFFSSTFLISGIIILLSYNSSLIGFLNAIIIFIFIFISKFFLQKRIKKKAEIRSAADVELFKTIQHAFGSFIETVLFKKERLFLNYFTKQLKLREFQTMYLNIINSLPKIFIEIIAILAITLYVIFFIGSSSDLINVLPILTLIIVSFIRLMPALNVLILSINQLKFLTVGKNIILSDLNSISKESRFTKDDYQKENIIFKKNLKIKNLSFKYESETKKHVFNDLNLEIQKGEKIAIVGESGVGKSTFINLLTGLLKPTSGKILIDDKSILENLKKWQDIISYIPQDIYLIDDTIEKNVTFSADDDIVDNKWLEETLKLSNIYKDINNLENKTQTIVGNRGIRFSGGQKQRIAIARAIYKKPQILIMDEPTSGLDKKNENELVDNMLSLSKDLTLIMISHNIDRHRDKFKVFKLKDNLLKREF
jgi:ATP-binding cassette, subfamily B, bacterial PglK